MTTVTENTNLPNYTASVTTDANGNITAIDEVQYPGETPTVISNNSFEYDRENRITEQVVNSGLNTTIAHGYDGLGRLVKTTRTVSGPTTTEYHHVRNGLQVVGNVDYTNSQTAPTWTNSILGLKPIESQQIQTNSSQQYINISDETSPARLTYHPTTSAAGNTSTVNSKGSFSVIDGAAPMKNSAATNSELFYHRSLTINQNTIALPSNKGTLEIAGTNLLYEGTRVKSFLLGRDLNPIGRGYGNYYAHGMFSAGNTRPRPTITPIVGFGNSVNNGSAFKFHQRSAGCWMEEGDCGLVAGGWQCNVKKCVYKPGDYNYGGQVGGDPCPLVTWTTCVLNYAKTHEYHRTGNFCFNVISSTCVESAAMNLYSQSSLVDMPFENETCKDYSIDHIMSLIYTLGAEASSCVDQSPCPPPIVAPMKPAGGGGCPGCGGAGGDFMVRDPKYGSMIDPFVISRMYGPGTAVTIWNWSSAYQTAIANCSEVKKWALQAINDLCKDLCCLYMFSSLGYNWSTSIMQCISDMCAGTRNFPRIHCWHAACLDPRNLGMTLFGQIYLCANNLANLPRHTKLAIIHELIHACDKTSFIVHGSREGIAYMMSETCYLSLYGAPLP